MARDTADIVVIGAGAIGGWAAYLAANDGAGRVVVLDKGLAGQGASSRAAGMVRAQGGTAATIALGRWSIDFYNRQRELLGTDSGFRELGYLILALDARDEREGRARVQIQQAAGLDDVRWVSAEQARRLNPTLAPTGHRGGGYRAADGCVDPPRNVRAYSLAMRQAGAELREHVEVLSLTTAGRAGARRVTGVETTAGRITAPRVLITGGPELRALGRRLGLRIPVGAVRHQVAVTEPHPAFRVKRQAMVFDLRAGLYWRLEENGLLFGMSNPDEAPGPATEIDQVYLRKMQRRLARFVPVTKGLGLRKAWAATIEYTPDHLPVIGPALLSGGDAIEGAVVATAGGHGMMWGPALARAAADLLLEGSTDVLDTSDLGLDRFDRSGRSRLAPDAVALPFPSKARA
jgi:sarcosine oxidase, subunit beta